MTETSFETPASSIVTPDNATALGEKAGQATFAASTSPGYLRGLAADAKITLGPPDHARAVSLVRVLGVMTMN